MTVSDEARRFRLLAQIANLPAAGLAEVEAVVARLLHPHPCTPSLAPASLIAPPMTNSGTDLDWPHAPTHRLSEFGTYFVTCGTYLKPHHFRGAERLDHLQAELLAHLKNEGWQLEAWAVFSNHYHFVAHMLQGATVLDAMLKELHRRTASYVNELDQEPGRQVWYNFWDTRLTIETCYYARLAYTHNNAVKHGLVPNARLYRWCSAGWFERTAKPAQVATMATIKTDRVKVPDDYQPLGI